MAAPRLELWTSLACDGGTYVCPVPLLAATASERLSGSQSTLTVAIAADHPNAALFARGGCLRLLASGSAIAEWIITTVSAADGSDDGVVSLTAQPGAETLLAWRGIVRTSSNAGDVTSVTFGRQTRAQLFASYIAPNASADGTAWFGLGTQSWSAEVINGGTLDKATRLEAVKAFAGTAELVLRRVGDTGYVADYLTRRGSTAPRYAWVGRQIARLEREAGSDQYASEVTPYGTGPTSTQRATLGDNAWVLGTATGAGPYWIPLTDAEGGGGPIAIDGQLGTGPGGLACYLLRTDGGTTAITDSRASDHAVHVASLTGLTAGEHVQIVADASGNRLTTLTHPLRRTPRVAMVTDEPSLVGGRNLVRNGTLQLWTDATTPVGFSAQGGTVDVAEYRYSEPSTVASGIVADGTTVLGVTTISIRGAITGARFYRDETLTYVSGTTRTLRIADAVVVVDGAGKATFAVQSATPTIITDGTAYTVAASNPTRPLAFPADTVYHSRAARLLSSNADTSLPPAPSTARWQTAPITVKYVAGLGTLRASAGLTLWSQNALDNVTTGRQLPLLFLLNTGAGTLLDWAAVTSTPANATTNATLFATASIAADTTVACAIVPGVSTTGLATYVRYVTLAYDSATNAGVMEGGANGLWRLANAKLLALGGNRYRIAWADVSALLDPSAPLALGDALHLRSARLALDEAVRVVGLTLDLVDPMRSTIDIDVERQSVADTIATLLGTR